MTKTIWAVVGVSVAATAAMAVALVIVLAGGGGDDPEPEGPVAPLAIGSDAAPSGAAPEGLEEFQECLEDEGVELPSPGEQPSGDNLGELQDAVESCREHLPEGAGFGVAPPGAPVPQN